jgi:4-methylaminobutanoate oxidase (formaldehyde-forming)
MIEAGEPIDRGYLEGGEWEIDIAGTRYPLRVDLRTMYDPTLERVKG